MSKKHKKLHKIINTLSEWEAKPILFLALRIAGGQQIYGPGKNSRDWKKEMAEEAADFMNYYIWALEEGVFNE